MKIGKIVILAAVFGIAGVAHARASTIGPNCGTCQGSVYTLTNLGLASTDLNSADGSFDTWRIALTIDTSGYSGTGDRIDEVAIKVSSAVDMANLESVTYGSGVSAASGEWHLNSGGINADGCSGSGSGFDCADWVGVGLTGGALVGQGPITWVFNVDINSPLLTGLDGATIKARYVDATVSPTTDAKVGALVSENITLTSVPEPGTLGLLMLGAGSVMARRRRS